MERQKATAIMKPEPQDKITVSICVSAAHLRAINEFAIQTKLPSINQAIECAIEDLCGMVD